MEKADFILLFSRIVLINMNFTQVKEAIKIILRNKFSRARNYFIWCSESII